MNQDIRRKQRLQNYEAALKTLDDAVNLSKQRELSNLEKQGLIQSFEFTHELAWNLLKDYFAYQGTIDISGSRDAAREAFQKGLISQGEVWMEMIKSRNQTSHTYNQSTANEITQKVCNEYIEQFLELKDKMQGLAKSE